MRKGDRGLVVVGASLESGDVVSGEGLEGAFADDDILLEEMRTEEEEASHAKSAGAGSGDCWWWVVRACIDQEAEDRWHVSLAGAILHSWAGVIPGVLGGAQQGRKTDEGQEL